MTLGQICCIGGLLAFTGLLVYGLKCALDTIDQMSGHGNFWK